MTPPFFNLIVPTKSRANTLYWTLRCLLLQDYPHFQIIVSDNCSEDDTAEIVKGFASDKIRYYRTPERLSMSSNYEFALSKAEKGYVMMIGDDDGLTANALSMLAPIIQSQKPAAFIGKKFVYNWDSYPFPNLANLLTEPKGDDVYFWVESSKALELTSSWMYIFNFANYAGISLSSIYHGGCASVELIQQIVQRDGQFFNCQFPDYYSAIIITAEVERYLFIETPYFIAGSSGNSTGVSAFLNQKDKKSEFQQFQKDNNIPLDEPLVFCHSFALFTAEATLKAKKYNSNVKMFDWKNLFTKMVEDASLKPNKGQYDDVIEKTLQIAAANQLQDYVKELIIKYPFQEKKAVRTVEGYVLSGLYYNHHTENKGVKNIEDAAKLATELSKNRKPVFVNTQMYFAKKRTYRFFNRVFLKIKRMLTRS